LKPAESSETSQRRGGPNIRWAGAALGLGEELYRVTLALADRVERVLCLAQFLLQNDALIRFNQAFDPIPMLATLFRQHRSDLIHAGCGVARE